MLESLYEKLYMEILRWCTNMCGNAYTAEELVQEAFLRAAANEGVLEALTYNKQRAWMYRVTRNLFVDYCRKLKRENLYSFDDEEGETKNLVQEDFGEEEIIWSMVLSVLPEEERNIFVMRYFMGYTSAELSRHFDMPAGTVRSKLHSARKRLRKELKVQVRGE